MKTNKPNLSAGLGNNARSNWSGERITPNQQQQLIGFYVGQVMDDQDEQRMGRVWVYIPGVSSKRFDENSLPSYGGTTPDRQASNGLSFDQSMRNGWIMVGPMTPFFGSDDYRNQARPDGSNSAEGDVNSYGMTAQPRIGDFVGVMFANGDPNSGYWMGMIPKQNRNGMVPGVPGVAANAVSSREKNEVVGQVQPEATLPAMDRAATNNDPLAKDQKVSSDLARNIARAGLASDPHRGAGTSGARRESPSYVTGLKSAGWSYDSEKYNRDVDGKQFRDRVADVYHVNSTGHQITMDDHPDHQSMRLRTSNGSQIYMNDSGAEPYIYIQTASGGVWIELSDSGSISIFAESDLNIHAEGDLNLTVDGDMKAGVGGDYEMRVGGTYTLAAEGLASQYFGDSSMISINGEHDLLVRDDMRFTVEQDLNQRVGENELHTVGGRGIHTFEGTLQIHTDSDYDLETSGGATIVSGDNIKFNSAESMVLTTSSDLCLQSTNATNIKAGKSLGIQTGDDISIKGGGDINMDGDSDINLNSGKSVDIDDPEYGVIERPAIHADYAAEPILPLLNKTPMAPTSDQIIGNSPTDFQESVAGIVPQHQPWSGRTGVGSTIGTNGVTGFSAMAGAANPSNNIACVRSNTASTNYRTGAGFLDSLFPDFSMGGFEQVFGQIAVFSGGDNYSGTAQGEAPTIHSLRIGGAGEVFSPNDLSLSKTGLSFIKNVSSFLRTPRLDASKTTMITGFGSKLETGLSFAGVVMDSDLMRKVMSFSNDFEKSLAITRKEANELLSKDLDKVQSFIRETFANNEFTQQQFDALVSYAHSIGISNLKSSSSGKAVIAAILSGDMGKAQSEMYKNVYVGGALDCSMVDRRRAEVSRFGQPNNPGNRTYGNRGYTPSGKTVNIANFKMSEDVRNAIVNAETKLVQGIPKGYLFALASIESGFNRFAQNTTSSAGGLFQFIRDTGNVYGIDSNRARNTSQARTSPYNAYEVYDPEINALAAAQFSNDNYQGLVNRGVTDIDAAVMYAAHFFGLGGASRFFLAKQQDSNQPAALVRGMRKPAVANRNIFYHRDGTYKSLDQVYGYFYERVEKPRQYFVDGANVSVPPASSEIEGAITWKRGSRNPSFTTPDKYPEYGVSMASVKQKVEQAALATGLTEMYFNSGFRFNSEVDPDLAGNGWPDNSGVGGATKSLHLTGKALDLHVGWLDIKTQREFIINLIAQGITGLGIGTNTIHVDIRDHKATWTYSGGNAHVVDVLRANGWRA